MIISLPNLTFLLKLGKIDFNIITFDVSRSSVVENRNLKIGKSDFSHHFIKLGNVHKSLGEKDRRGIVKGSLLVPLMSGVRGRGIFYKGGRGDQKT